MYNFRLKRNSKFEHFIDDIAINLWSSWNFASMEDTRKKNGNPIVDLSKFTSNKKKNIYIYIYIYIWSGVVTFVYKTIIKFVAKFCSKFNYVGPTEI